MNKLIIKTTDIYQIVYFLTCGTTTIESIEVLPRGKQAICQFAISGEHLDALEQDYINRLATINLFEFRKILQQVNGLIDKARKTAKKQEQDALKEQGGNS